MLNRFFVGALLVFASGCATVNANRSAPRLRMVDANAPRMLPGINDGFHAPLPPEIAAHYCEPGREMVLRSPVLSAEQAVLIRQSVAACPQIHVLLLVENADRDLVAALATHLQEHRDDLPPIWGIELGN